MAKIETVDGTNWREFVGAPTALLMLSKTDCANCTTWTDELTGYLETDHPYENVRFGKVVLDRPGLAEFKREHPWIADLDDLPHNVVFVDGERTESWTGGGLERMITRLDRVLG